jgi:hypothetical protein
LIASERFVGQDMAMPPWLVFAQASSPIGPALFGFFLTLLVLVIVCLPTPRRYRK